VNDTRLAAALDRKTQLERHIEARDSRRRTGRLDTREVVKRVLAGGDQLGDPFETIASAGQLERGMGR
jgi:hypothetical protein